jgi:FkbM family methyltransferase
VKQLVARALGAVYRLLAPLVVRLERFSDRSLLPLPPAYGFVQDDTVQNLAAYLGGDARDVRRIVVVGVWHGHEVEEMLDRFPHAIFLLLEPSRDAFAELQRRFGQNPRVQVLQVAASDSDGTTTFHEMSVDGTGSLLPLAAPGDDAFLAPGIREADSYEVRTARLDSLDELRDDAPIDCLWVDVQGMELPVLRGAEGIIDRVRSAFLEVATDKQSYEGATSFDDLARWVSERGFRLASLGTDPANGQGNALWLATGGARSASPGTPARSAG